MDPIPAKVDRFLISNIQRIDKARTGYFIILALLIALISALLWVAAAVGSSRQFRFLTLICPVLLSYLTHLFAPHKRVPSQLIPAWLFFLLSFLLGKFLIFSHFFTALPNWLNTSEMSDFGAALSYVPFVFNKTQINFFVNDISLVFDNADFFWLIAGFYIIWRHTIFTSNQEPNQINNEHKYFKRRFR